MATNPRVDPVTDIIVPEPPRLVSAPDTWDPQFQDQYSNVLRLYFNRLTNLLRELNVATGETGIYPLGTAGDAFGRLRTSAPYTLFDSKNRFQKDPQFNETLTAGATSTYSSTNASVTLALDGTASQSAIRQTYRVFPYQPGKSLLVFATFSMGAALGGVETKVGYFDGTNGVYFRRSGSTLYFEIMKNGSVSETVAQASWNGDKMDGTGVSGVTLDPTKTQILYMDFEWLGVGTVRCGFVQDGKLYVCHSFHHANTATSVYMTTATLPVRYEIEDSAGAGDPSSLQQICSTVMSEGGYNQKSAPIWARRTAVMAATTSFQPIVSIQIKSGSEGAVIIPSQFTALPVGSVLDYEVALIKNPTLTGASFASNSLNVNYDVTATALTGGTIVSTTFIAGSNQGSTTLDQGQEYNFDLQLGVDLSGTSDIYTLAARTLSGSDDIIGALSYYDLTD
jgi:hypothetical protein